MRKIGFILLTLGMVMILWFGYQEWKGAQTAHIIDSHLTKAFDGKVKPKANNFVQKDRPVIKTGVPVQSVSTAQVPPPNPNYKVGEQVAELVIPKIQESYDVFWGTDAGTLKKGAGMYVSKWTVPPGYSGHTVISGHRDTVFRPLKDLKKGDMLYVSYQGVDYQYSIKKIWITNANDRTVIVKKQTPTLTLTTCYPFYFVGDAPNRYIIQAGLVDKGNLLKSDQ